MKKILYKVKNNNIWKEISLFPKWTIKNMVLVGILIAISVSFTIVVAQIVPIVNLPTYKFSFIGLPVKITGFIFGPIIGIFVGIVSDFLSLLFIPPAGYNLVYTLATAVNGLIAGLFGMYFNQIIKTAFSKDFRIQRIGQKINLYIIKYKILKSNNQYSKMNKIANKIISLNNKKKYINDLTTYNTLSNIYLFVGLLLLVIVISTISWFIMIAPEYAIQDGLIRNRYALIGLMCSGTMMMMCFLVYSRFRFKTETYLKLVPIVVFCSFLELVNIPILSFADLISLGNGQTKDIFVWISQHVLSGPIKIWFNTFVIFYTYSIVSKLINKNNKLSY
ncbi:ECF transporter S component [Mycoplasmopsis felis]|uniref:ECF transporter S component n=1 Tax=Mycoplasmopsis felis TaxID=33923 RepID=UPI002AFE2B7E|nr:ECF transporter S component [Mycoplasmopsis felis]WQQ10245.1 ECF transporter S component [Mycoplasmopsis felis]